MTNLNGQSMDLLQENVTALRQLFPEAFCDDQVDFDILRQLLGEWVEDDRERYHLTWSGKVKSLRLSQTPSLGTLRPCVEESKHWGTTGNLYLEGDNLEVLKLLQKSYHRKVKMIYIDPPYNTGSDFIYSDNFSDSMEHYMRITGQLDEEGNRLSSNKESAGRFHTNWLNMMYPRLRLARSLLTDDGVIFISIDDHEVGNLLKICDELFGEENRLALISWKRKKEISNDARNVATQGEYLLCFARGNGVALGLEPISQDYLDKSYHAPTEAFPLGKWRPVPLTVSKGLSGGGYTYSITTPAGVTHTRVWAYPEHSYQNLLAQGRVYFGKDEGGVPQRVMYAHESKGQPVSNWWGNTATNKEGKKDILDLLEGNVFDTPKPTGLIERMLKIASDPESIVLDFFSGSATTGHAVMRLNREDGGHRRFILVQLPELCAPDSEAAAAGYKNICAIGKERLRRAGERIQVEIADQNTRLGPGEPPETVPDIGFQVFKLDTSNLKKWQPDFNSFEQSLLDSVGNFLPGRGEMDVVYEFMLKLGLDLSCPVETHTVDGKNVYFVGGGTLMICLDDAITEQVAHGMVALHQALNPPRWQVICKDNGFPSDSVKANVRQLLKCAGLEDDAFVTV